MHFIKILDRCNLKILDTPAKSNTRKIYIITDSYGLFLQTKFQNKILRKTLVIMKIKIFRRIINKCTQTNRKLVIVHLLVKIWINSVKK